VEEVNQYLQCASDYQQLGLAQFPKGKQQEPAGSDDEAARPNNETVEVLWGYQ